MSWNHPTSIGIPCMLFGFTSALAVNPSITSAVSAAGDLAGSASGLMRSAQMGFGVLGGAVVVSVGGYENFENNNLSDYLVITKKKLSNLKKQIIIDKSPININDLIQTLNINFLKSKFTEQSKIDLGRYNLNLNSRILNQNEKELELTEKESSILIFLKQSKDPVKIDQLQEKVWGYNSELETHTVETHVYRLRKKINDKFYDNEFIISDKKGYFLNEKKK